MFRRSFTLFAALLCPSLVAQAQVPVLDADTHVWTGSALTSPRVAPGRLVVVYRDGRAPGLHSMGVAAVAGGTLAQRLSGFGMDVVTVAPGTEAVAINRISAQPEVLQVLQDRYVVGHALQMRAANAANASSAGSLPASTDTAYASAQGWAVRGAGGFGNGVAGGPASGPWDTTRGGGVRIAILDSGVDPNHPDIRPNLALNLSEIDQTALPSACDDGSPVDQTGHGTWAASLAAGAVGSSTGRVAGVAPEASILNIKVMQRMPGSGSTTAAACAAGQAGGLLSWVLKGLEDAVSNKADVVAVSLGTLVDLTTGDGAGWKANFDRVTYAALQSGTVIVAAAGNDGLDLAKTTLIELPAQARGVLPVVASTNPGCVENLATDAPCVAGSISRAYYSNHGANLNAIAAPGGSYPAGTGDNLSGWIEGACASGLANTQDGLPAAGASLGCFNLGHTQYVQAMGTSASAPLVAGAAAILHAARPNWSATDIINALRTSASAAGTLNEPELNLPAALALESGSHTLSGGGFNTAGR